MSFHIKIGNYRFSKNLGTGSFGKVKLAFNEVTGHKVAIKILNKKRIKQQGVFEKVKREIKVLRLFNHPHIIKHYEFIDTPSDIFMVIEYASGGELFDLISRRERLEENEARKYFQQIISAVEYTHAHKITHRDLKPENLLLDENNNIKLIDFGLSNSMKDSQALKTACGSPNYAAPEIISGKAYSGVEVDVWSCGVILYAMVCGSLPFDDDSMTQLFNKIKEGKFYMPINISDEVKDLINRMLQPNPVKRISMPEIRQHPWYRTNLPLYIQELSSIAYTKKSDEIDQEIIQKLFTLNLNLSKAKEDEIIKAIESKKNTEFCGVYELLHQDKMKKLYFSTGNNSEKLCGKPTLPHETDDKNRRLLRQQHQTRLDKILRNMQLGKPQSREFLKMESISTSGSDNATRMTPSTSTTSYSGLLQKEGAQQARNRDVMKWQFGLQFSGNPLEMFHVICHSLVKLGIEWQYVSKDMKLKCRTIIDANKLIDDDDVIKEFLRKNFLKFYVQIFKIQSTQNVDERYMVDVQVIKGNLIVFQDYARRFLDDVRNAGEQQGFAIITTDVQSPSVAI